MEFFSSWSKQNCAVTQIDGITVVISAHTSLTHVTGHLWVFTAPFLIFQL